MSPSEAEQLLAAEVAADAARAELQRRQFDRHRGVAWSGLSPDAAPRQDEHALRARVAARLAAREAWRAGPDGALLTALSACQAAARDAYVAAERARAGIARGEPADWRAKALTDIAARAVVLTEEVRSARRALRP